MPSLHPTKEFNPAPSNKCPNCDVVLEPLAGELYVCKVCNRFFRKNKQSGVYEKCQKKE